MGQISSSEDLFFSEAIKRPPATKEEGKSKSPFAHREATYLPKANFFSCPLGLGSV
jgi:hypothetical protein